MNLSNMKIFNINFTGVLDDTERNKFKREQGIYCVYVGSQNNKTVTPRKLVYVGETGDFRDRHYDKEHEHYQDFLDECKDGEEIFYNYAVTTGFTDTDRVRVQDALIYELQPSINTSSKETFNHPETIVNIKGNKPNGLMPNKITAKKD